MSGNEKQADSLIKFLQSEEAVPVISAVLIVLLVLLFSDLGYRLIEMTTTLLFYAVLVRMWTAMTPSDSELLRGPFAHPMFLFISTGAVAMGIMIEQWITSLSGSVLPAQFLALAVLVSKMYLKFRESGDLRETLLWTDKQGRYVILIPCLVVLFLPVAVYQYGITSFLVVDSGLFVSRTTDAFLFLNLLGIGVGTLLYLVIEEDEFNSDLR